MSPKTEWEIIKGETETPQSLLGKYVIPLALIPAIAYFIGYGLIGMDVGFVRIGSIHWGLIMALDSFVGSIISYFICTFVVDALAPSFSSEKNTGKSAQLVAYSSTAAWIVGIFNIIPSLSILGILGLYSIYLFYLGIPVLKKTPEDKRIGYMAVCAIVIIVVAVVVNLIISKIVYSVAGNPFMPEGIPDLRLR
jgi:hypothetical protein